MTTQGSGRSVCVFCGAQKGTDPDFQKLALEVGRSLAQRGLRLVYGGAKDGLMGAAANGALAEGGDVLGVLPAKLAGRELAHPSVRNMITVGSMAERKDILMRESDIFLVLPGGLGTLDELFEVLTANTLGFMNKQVIILNQKDYYTPLIAWLDSIAMSGLSRPPAQLFSVTDSLEGLHELLS
ncbi:MAG: hypothetical protein RIR26_2555 [Pseudomonadota bacterium]